MGGVCGRQGLGLLEQRMCCWAIVAPPLRSDFKSPAAAGVEYGFPVTEAGKVVPGRPRGLGLVPLASPPARASSRSSSNEGLLLGNSLRPCSPNPSHPKGPSWVSLIKDGDCPAPPGPAPPSARRRRLLLESGYEIAND